MRSHCSGRLSSADDGGECSLGTGYRAATIAIFTRYGASGITFPARISTARRRLDGEVGLDSDFMVRLVPGAGIFISRVCFWRPFIGDTLPNPLASAAT